MPPDMTHLPTTRLVAAHLRPEEQAHLARCTSCETSRRNALRPRPRPWDARRGHAIVFDLAELEVVWCGLALPRMPLSEVVDSFFYDLMPDGSWRTCADDAILRLEVTAQGVRAHARAPRVVVREASGEARATRLSPGESVTLGDGDELRSSAGAVRFEALDGPYAGLMLQDTEVRVGVESDETVELGRQPKGFGFALPDRQGQDNLRWCPGPRAARARTNGFTLDRALAGRRQASLRVGPDGSHTLAQLHDRCPTWVLRAGERALVRVDGELQVQVGDLVVAGTTALVIRAW